MLLPFPLCALLVFVFFLFICLFVFLSFPVHASPVSLFPLLTFYCIKSDSTCVKYLSAALWLVRILSWEKTYWDVTFLFLLLPLNIALWSLWSQVPLVQPCNTVFCVLQFIILSPFFIVPFYIKQKCIYLYVAPSPLGHTCTKSPTFHSINIIKLFPWLSPFFTSLPPLLAPSLPPLLPPFLPCLPDNFGPGPNFGLILGTFPIDLDINFQTRGDPDATISMLKHFKILPLPSVQLCLMCKYKATPWLPIRQFEPGFQLGRCIAHIPNIHHFAFSTKSYAENAKTIKFVFDIRLLKAAMWLAQISAGIWSPVKRLAQISVWNVARLHSSFPCLCPGLVQCD